MAGDAEQSPPVAGDEATTPGGTVRPVRIGPMASDPRDTPRTPDSASSQRSSLGRGISSLMLNELDGAKDGEAGEVGVEIERAVAMDADDENDAADATNDTSRSGDSDAATPGRVDDGQSRSPIARPEDVSDEVDALVTAAVDKGVGVAARTLREAMSSARTVEGAGGRAADAMARALAESILARMMPRSAATRASLEPVGDDTCADVRRTSFLTPSPSIHDDAERSVVEMSESAARCSPRAVLLAAEVLPRMPPDEWSVGGGPGPRLRLVRGMFHALRARMGNCLSAAAVGVFPALVKALADHLLARDDDDDDDDGDLEGKSGETEESRILRLCVRLVAAHHTPVGHLRMWLAACASLAGTGRGALLDELDAALALPQSKGPARMFVLDGESGGVLGASVGGPWPFNEHGFAVVTWVYLETTRESDDAAAAAAAVASHAATSSGGAVGPLSAVGPAAAAAAAAAASGEGEDHMPRLFSFVSTEDGGGSGVEAYFHGRYLVLEATGGGGAEAGSNHGAKRSAKVAMPFTHPFSLKRWTCVAVEYSTRGHGEARLYIDGVPVETHRVTLPFVRGSLGFCCVGTNPPAAMAGLQRRRRQCALHGALGPVYVFNEPIGARRVSQLNARGGTYVPGYGAREGYESTEGRGAIESGGGAGGKKIARGFQLANAAAKAVVKVASDGVKRIDQRAARGLGLTSGRDGDWDGDEDGEENEKNVWNNSEPRGVRDEWAGLDADLAPSLLQLLHPAAAFCGHTGGDASSSPTGDRRVPDLSPANQGGAGDRNGSLLGAARVAARALLRDSLWAVAPGGPACLLPLACPALCSKTFAPVRLRLRAEGRDERARRVAAAAAALRPALSAMGRACEGGGAGAASSLDALAAIDAPRLIALALPSAIDAMRAVHERRGRRDGGERRAQSTGADWVDCVLSSEGTDLDAAEVAAVDALERLLEAARDHPTLRRQVCTHLFLSLEPWTGGGGSSGGGSSGGGSSGLSGSGVGVGARAMRRVIRAVASAAHAEGGCAIRELCGVRRLLDAAATHLSPAEGALDLDPIGDVEGESEKTDSFAQSPATPEASIRASRGSVRGASTEDKLALMDELVAAVSTLAHGGQSSRGGADETATALAGFLSRCACPRLAARVVALAASLAAAPNADRASAFTRAFCRAGGVEVCLALTRAAALNEPGRGSNGDGVRGEEGETKSHIRDPSSPSAGAGLVAACVRLLGRLVARGEAEVAGATSALVERAVGHCLRRAPTALLTENVYDAAMRAALDFFGAKNGSGGASCVDASSIGADAFAREISLSASPVRFLGSAAARGVLGAALASIHLAPLAVRRRCVRDHLVLACADAENRSVINQSPEWPRWLVEVLAASANDDEVVRAGGDLLDVQARHALKLREGWRTIESVAAEFVNVAGSSICHPNEFLNETLDRALVNLALFATAELKGAAAKGLKGAPRKEGRGGRRVAGDGGSFGSRDFGETSLDEFLRGDPTAVTRTNAAALAAIVLDRLRGTDSTATEDGKSQMDKAGGGEGRNGGGADEAFSHELVRHALARGRDGRRPMHLPLLRAAVGVVEVLVDEPVGLLGDDSGTPGPLERGDGGESIVDSSSSPETRHRALCIALAAAREEAKAIGRSNDDDSRQSDDVPTPDGSTPLIPSAIADAIVQGFRGSRTSPDFFLAFQSRQFLWGVSAGTPLGRALACVHRILSHHLVPSPNDSGDDVVGAMAAVGVLYDEVWRLNREFKESNEASGGGDGAVPSAYARAAIAYLLALASRWRERIIAECSDGDGGDGGFGTLESAAAARDTLGSEELIISILADADVWAAWDKLRKPPWVGVLGSPAIKRRLAAVGDGTRGDGAGNSLGPAASSSRRAAAAASSASREASREVFELAWEGVGASSDAVNNAGTAGIAARWRKLGYDASSRLAMASAAERTSARAGESAWRVYAESLIDCGALFARLVPPDDDPGWTHSALCVAPSETARRRRYRLRMSYGEVGHRRVAAAADGVEAEALSLEDEKPRLPFTGKDFGEPGEEDDADANAPAAAAAADADAPAAAAAAAAAAAERERDNDVMIAAAAAAAAAAALGAGDARNGSLILQCDAEMVTPTGVATGRLLVTTRDITFQHTPGVTPSGATVGGTKDDDAAGDAFDFVAKTDDDPYATDDLGGGTSWRWPLDSLRGVQTRRYLLRRSALEIFLLDRRAYFLDLRTQEQRTRVYSTVAGLRPRHCGKFLEIGNSSPEALFRKSDITARWCRREMSNFDYIMALNTLAGRTYNDITQYPVFPWVIADYESETLNLDDPKTYRDLGKPVGALTKSRLERIKERYDAFDDPDIPKFHYGSHYSSAGIVLFYLLRLEPFTSLAHQLQGGKFDHADRLFNDVPTCWKGVTSDVSDVKELIPEFYYLPEMFVNVNNVDFGVKQSTGRAVNHCGLPPWAADAFDFVTKNRAALESEHVSRHLHLWIDLVFGYKQRGPAAVRANNVFYYLTYEGNVDMEAITDPTLLKATQDQIANFGQTPSQLTRKPHPRRMSAEDTFGGSHWLLANPHGACRYPLRVPPSACGGIPAAVVAVAPERAVLVHVVASAGPPQIVTHRWLPNTPDSSALPFTFEPACARRETGTMAGFFRSVARRAVGANPDAPDSAQAPAPLAMGALAPELASSLRRIRDTTHDRVAQSSHRPHSSTPNAPTPRLPCEVTPDGSIVVVGGGVDGGVRAFEVRTGAPIASDARSTNESGTRHQFKAGHASGHVGHVGHVTALALSDDGGVLVTASSDSSLAVWTLRSSGSSGDDSGGERPDGGRGPIGVGVSMGGGGVGVSMGDAMARAAREAERHPATGAARGYAPPEHHAGERSAVAHALEHAGVSKAQRAKEGDDPVARIVREARARAGVTGGGRRKGGGGGDSPGGDSPTLRGPHFILRGHRESVAAVAVSTDLAVALATSPRTGSTLHCLLTGRFLRAVPELRGELCALSPEGTAMAWERRGHVLRVATLNGDVVRAASLADDLPPLTTKPIVSSDGRFVVLGTERAAAGDPKPAGVALLEVPELRVAHVWELPGGAGVSSMTLTGDNTNLLVSGTDGSLTVLADPRLGMRLVSQMFNLGWETMV